jgi:molybdenum cofactor synthesis domain-containing protein
MVRVGILVASDSRSAGSKADMCIPAISALLEKNGFSVVRTAICPDEILPLRDTIREWARDGTVDVILTSGGTGVSPRDVTPEATRPLLERDLPGIPEAMRAASRKKTVYAVVSRGLAGLIGDVLVINLPGSPKAAVENLEPVIGAIPHIMRKAKGDASECAPASG